MLEHYPRDELFQVDEDTLYDFALAILQLDERPRVRVLARRDRFDRFVSVLVFVPRERYDSHIRVKIGELSGARLHRPGVGLLSVSSRKARWCACISSSAAPAARRRASTRATLEREVEAIIRTWSDGLCDALALSHPPGEARALFERYRQAFSEGFHEAYAPQVAAGDIRTLESLSDRAPARRRFPSPAGGRPALRRPEGLEPGAAAAAVGARAGAGKHGFQGGGRAHLPHRRRAGDGVWFHDMLLRERDGGTIDLGERKGKLEAAFLTVMRGQAENDGYNALTLAGGLAWRDVALIRTLSRFLRQIRVPYSQDYMWATLVKHAGIAAEIVALFHARFDPQRRRARARGDRKRRSPARIEDALAGGRKPRRGPHPAPFRQCRAVGDPHQFLPARHGRRSPSR